MHGWKRNPKAPSSLWDGLVLDGAYAGLHPGTNRFVDGSGLENHGTLTDINAAVGWQQDSDIGRSYVGFSAIASHIVLAQPVAPTTAFSFACWIRPGANPNVNHFTAFASDLYTYNNGCWIGSQHYYDVTKRALVYLDGVADVILPNCVPPPDTWTHVCVTWRSGTAVRWYNDGRLANSSSVATGAITNHGVAAIGYQASSIYKLGRASGAIADSLFWMHPIAPDEITWLADRSNRMYIPDTRRAIWVPTPFNPALMRRRRRMAGAR